MRETAAVPAQSEDSGESEVKRAKLELKSHIKVYFIYTVGILVFIFCKHQD